MKDSLRARRGRKTQTTLRLPQALYEQSKALVEEHRLADSINELVANALNAYIKAVHRKMIDEEFRGMEQDERYQKEAARITREFTSADLESIQIADEDVIEVK